MLALQVTILSLALAAVPAALAELTIFATATHEGRAVDPADVVLAPRALPADTPPVRPRWPNRFVRRQTFVRSRTSSSSNWCGAAVHATAADPIASVGGLFQVPSLSQRDTADSDEIIGSWIGIDGDTWQASSFQCGVISSIDDSGEQSNAAWVTYLPNGSYAIPNFPVNAGDWIKVSITAKSSTSIAATLTNLNQNYAQSLAFSQGAALGLIDAEWVVEAPYAPDGSLEPVPDFGTIWFEQCSATRSSGATFDLSGAEFINFGNGDCSATDYDSGDFWAQSS